MAGTAVTGQGAGVLTIAGYIVVTGDTIVVIYGHIRLGSAVFQSFEFEYEALFFLKMAGTAVLVLSQRFRVSVVIKRNCRHLVTTGNLRQVD